MERLTTAEIMRSLTGGPAGGPTDADVMAAALTPTEPALSAQAAGNALQCGCDPKVGWTCRECQEKGIDRRRAVPLSTDRVPAAVTLTPFLTTGKPIEIPTIQNADDPADGRAPDPHGGPEPPYPCECQQYGKTAVCWPSGKCMVCGGMADLNKPYTGELWNKRPDVAPRDVDTHAALVAANERLRAEVALLRDVLQMVAASLQQARAQIGRWQLDQVATRVIK